MNELMATEILGNSLGRWAAAAAVAACAWIVAWGLRRVLATRLKSLARHTVTQWDDILAEAISRTPQLFITVMSLFAGSLLLTLPDRLHTSLLAVVTIALLLQAGLWASYAFGAWLEQYRRRRLATSPASAGTVAALGFAGRVVLWSMVLLLILDNLGVDVTALVAGLGIGGIAVALAVQNILGDLFASLSIVIDKPFVIGDFLIVGDHLGTVESIGLKTTRLRSLSGEQLVFANADLLNSRIRNYGRMYERRVLFTIGVTYQTPYQKLERIPGIIREVVEAREKTRFDRSHFKQYGAFSLDFETVYYVTDPDYNFYMDVQQAINLAIHRRFEAEGIEFAYPTQTLYLQRAAGAGG